MTATGLASSVTLAKYAILIQLMFRASTFLMNTFLLRFMTKEALGMVNVRLTLLYMNIVFLSREAFRRGCLGDGSLKISKGFINLLWMIFPVGCVISIVIVYIWLHFVEVDMTLFPDYTIAVVCFAIASLLELVCEPFAIVSQACQFVRVRAIAEGTAALVKCVLTIGLVYYFPAAGLLPFSFAQIAYCLTITMTFISYFIYFFWKGLHKKNDEFPIKSFGDFFPSVRKFEIDRSLGWLVSSFWFQSALKQLLTEGEKFVMTFFELVSLSNQGIYDIINNLGSIVARSFFLPIEDGSYHLFTQNLLRGQAIEKQNKVRLIETANALSTLLTSLSIVGLCFVFFGPSYAYLLLDLVGGALLSEGEGPVLLRWYCGYVLLMAWNGVSEGFLNALMRKDEVDRHSRRMMFYSMSFLISALIFVQKFGVVGFIWANYINMSLRILYNLRFMRFFFKGTEYADIWRSIIPDPLVISAFACSATVTLYSEKHFCCKEGWIRIFIHVGIGCICLLFTFAIILIRHKNIGNVLWTFLRRKKP